MKTQTNQTKSIDNGVVFSTNSDNDTQYAVLRDDVEYSYQLQEQYIATCEYDELKPLAKMLKSKLQGKSKWIKFSKQELIDTGYTNADGHITLSDAIREIEN